MSIKHLTPFINSLAVLLGVAASLSSVSCNSKDEDAVADSYVTSESVAITDFSLSADLRVMRNLDSVFFSIDLEHGVVFNADSLPKGTNVTKLIPKITYPSTVTSAVIEMTGGSHREGTVNYSKNANDTIDFTGDVKLTLEAGKEISKTYTLKVNVHKSDPDTIYWDKIATMDLPSRLKDPVDQKTVSCGDRIVSLILESDGSFTIASTSDIFGGNWEKSALSLSFVPNLRSLTASPDGSLFILSDKGELFSSQNGNVWNSLDSDWSGIIGWYGDTLLGMRFSSAGSVMKSWPENAFAESLLPGDFPVKDFSNPITFINRWTPDPTLVIFGGIDAEGKSSSASWAFDGNSWADIANNPLPALSGLSVVNYYSYLKSSSNSQLKEFEVYLAFGGRMADGTPNRTVYISYDSGINWQKAQEYTQLPENIPAGFLVDALSVGTTMESSLSNRWKASQAKRRLPFDIEGDAVKWMCPYIFLFGGMDGDGSLFPSIRSGVLERLTFEPLF